MRKLMKFASLIVFVALLSGGGILGEMLSNQGFENVATIVLDHRNDGKISLWQDEKCTKPFPEVMDWGSFYPSKEKDKVVYIKNMGNIPIRIGWRQSGLIYEGVAHYGHTYFTGGTDAYDCTFRFYMTGIHGQAIGDGGGLSPLGEGEVIYASLRLVAETDVSEGDRAKFTIDFEVFECAD